MGIGPYAEDGCSVLRDQLQTLGGGFGLASSVHVQFFQNMADVGLHRGQLDVHHLGNLAVALVRADQAQDLLLRGGQHIVFRQPGLQKQGVVGVLQPWPLSASPASPPGASGRGPGL